MDGLHDSSPMVSSFWVRRSVLAPVRAEAAAASQPAWPPPMMQTVPLFTTQQETVEEGRVDTHHRSDLNWAGSVPSAQGSSFLYEHSSSLEAWVVDGITDVDVGGEIG